MANPDQLTLFLKKELDAAWAPEPWATRLIREGNGRLFLDERDLWPNGQFVTTNLIVSTKFLQEHPDVVKNWLRAHVELTDWINGHLPEAKKILNQQIQKETGKALTRRGTGRSLRPAAGYLRSVTQFIADFREIGVRRGVSGQADARSFRAL